MTDAIRVPKRFCPQCRAKLDAVTDPREGKRPKPGDFSVCIHCACLMIFNDDLTLRESTLKEQMWAFVEQPDLQDRLRLFQAAVMLRDPSARLKGKR
jgi:hypothetical protein